MPTFQARFYEDRYALGRLISTHCNSLGFTRRQFVERLGFFDRLGKGHKVLAEIMLTGVIPPYLTTLASALELDQAVVDDVLHLSAWQGEVEHGQEMLASEETYRANFRPHLQVRTERSRPEPLFIAALLTVERLRVVYFSEEITNTDENEREHVIRNLIQKHYRDSHGRILTFGKIVGYNVVYFPGFGGKDFATPFDRRGCQIGEIMMVRRLPEAMLGTKRGDTRLTGLLRDEPIAFMPTDGDLDDPEHLP